MRLLLPIFLIALTGCATGPWMPGNAHQPVGEAAEPLICSGKEECDLWWRRAQYFVTTHSGYKLQIATDMVIETYMPLDYSMRYGMKVWREPMPGGDRIWVGPSCGRSPLCSGSPEAVILEFKRYVRTGIQ